MTVVANISRPRVAYVLKRFPRLSETFIRNEIQELERRDVCLEIFSLLRPEELASHQAVARLRARVTYLPRRRLLKNLPLRSGTCSNGVFEERPFRKVFRAASPAAPAMFPGKDMDDTSVLLMQAAALASAAWARGVTHMHAHFATDATTVAMLASRLTGISYSFTAHAKDIFHTYTDRASDDAFLIEKIRNARFVVTVSDYNRQHLAKLAGPAAATKILRLYNGIDLDRFRPSSDGREPGLVLAVGRLIEKKGFRYLIDACVRLRATGNVFRCLIVGEGPDHATLSRQIAHRGLEDCVTLVGALPEERLLTLIQQARLFVLPAVVSTSGDRDGLPTVLLEALALGVPAISTTIAGIPEIIDHGRSGLLVPPEDPRRLADAIDQVLASPELQRRLGCEGRLKAERKFDLRRNVAVLRDLFARSAADLGDGTESGPDEDRIRYRG